MALYHVRLKPLSRGSRNTVSALAYRSGTILKCQRTGETFTYDKKGVQHVELLLPDGAPQWAKELQLLIAEDRQKGVQQLSDLAEEAEKRVDARLYRDYEFALPRELTDAQNMALAQEFVQDQMCQLGIGVLVNFHFDVDPKTGDRKPHCHAVMLTRSLTEEGLSRYKERSWETKMRLETWNEQVAAYGNFHLKMHGFEPSLDHRSYKERGLEIEPQPKLGRNIREMETRGKATTDKGQEFHQVKMRNLYRIMARPEIVIDIVTKSQSTFMWGDVQKVLARYVDDIQVFQQLDAKLKESKELVMLKKLEIPSDRPDITDPQVYTSRWMIQQEQKLVSLADSLSKRKTHPVKEKVINKVLSHHHQKFEKYGGLSPDQVQAIEHMVTPHQLTCVMGYAGAGKTTALEIVKEIWEKSGYAVYGLAPTGRAKEKLRESGFKAYTLDQFLNSYEHGRSQFKAKSILVLDECGMANTERLQKFLSSVKKLGVKAVTVGDGTQLQAVEAGPAFRLVTDRVPHVKLEYIVRQKQDWQKEATVLFGQNKTREALLKYDQHGCIKICEESLPDLHLLMRKGNYREIVLQYNLARRITGNIYHEMIADLRQHDPKEQNLWKHLRAHPDFTPFQSWQHRRQEAAQLIYQNLDHTRIYMKELGVDPVDFLRNFVGKEEKDQRVSQLQLPVFDLHQPKHICDPRAQTKIALVRDWYQSYLQDPENPLLMMSYSNRDTKDLNDQARQKLKQDGVLSKTEFMYTIHREQEDDFGKTMMIKEERAFAKGDRLIFTRNDNGLKVSNGTLGTVISLRKHKIKVRLDNSKEVVSFAPKLYPYFDQGWAATIHKNQSVTAKNALLLATFEMNRNLTTVGMTRHEESVKVYGSDLEFWRPEKLMDRLSRSHEKLSSFDYVDEQEVTRLIHRDNDIITRAFNRVSNQVSAIRYVSKRVFENWKEKYFGDSPVQYTRPMVQGSIIEEERARQMSEDRGRRTELYEERIERVDQVAPQIPQRILNQQYKPIPSYDRQDVLAHLSDSQVEQIFQQDIHHWVNVPKCSKHGHHIRYGSGKGFVINLQDKTWYSHYHADGGDIFGYVSQSKNISYGEAIKRIAEDIHAPQSTYLSASEQAKRLEAWQREKAIEAQRDLEASKAQTLKVFNQTQPITGTIGETYLKQHRGYLNEIPGDIRFCKSRYTPRGNHPALVSFARNQKGEMTGYQEIFLDPVSGNKAKELEVVKKSGGFCKGSTVRIQEGEGVTYISEGVETALSIKAAGVKGEILSGFGRYVFKNAGPKNKVIVFCADYDGMDAKTHDTLNKDKQYLENKGYTVHVVWPATEGQKKIDFNDILKACPREGGEREGAEKIKTILREQLPEIAQFVTSQHPRVNVIDQKDALEKDNPKEQVAYHLIVTRDRPTTTGRQTFESASQIQKTLQEPPQERDILDTYRDLTAKRSKYNILSLSPEEREEFLSVGNTLKKIAHEIQQNEELFKRAENLGLSEMIKAESSLYEMDIRREYDNSRAKGMGRSF